MKGTLQNWFLLFEKNCEKEHQRISPNPLQQLFTFIVVFKKVSLNLFEKEYIWRLVFLGLTIKLLPIMLAIVLRWCSINTLKTLKPSPTPKSPILHSFYDFSILIFKLFIYNRLKSLFRTQRSFSSISNQFQTGHLPCLPFCKNEHLCPACLVIWSFQHSGLSLI